MNGTRVGVELVDGDAFLAGRALLGALARELTGIVPVISAVCADCGGPHGRPEAPGVSLGLAHVGNRVVGVAAHRPVGIDAELASQSWERLDAIEQLTGHRSIEHWTIVEAVLKADGRGLRVDPRAVVVEREGVTAVVSDTGRQYELSHPSLAGDLVVTVALAVDPVGD